MAAQSQAKAYSGSVGRPISSQAATKATAQIDMATNRRRRWPSGAAGPGGGAGGVSVTVTSIAVQVNGGRTAHSGRDDGSPAREAW
ncbi:hypothetical protein Pen02_78390 [Plantactinospora endophytica]|uniref:Uncharacterized protein n=1 Tax=Plantactinospora endophytica TaxID=673535 RepID=A0ABQ4EDV2_9ACTN|nr:hypothetical protein Pen02_78390 [Plantactinospora endophytica]